MARLTQPGAVNPAAFCDWLQLEAGVKNDYALALTLETDPAIVSRVRKGGPISATMVLSIHERLGPMVATIRERMVAA